MAVPPTAENIDGVQVEWAVTSGQLTNVSFTVSDVPLIEDIHGDILLYNLAAMAKVFAASRFISDRIQIQTGYDALNPFAVVGCSPQEYVGESAEETICLEQHIKQHRFTSHAYIAHSQPFCSQEMTDFERLAIPIGHVARGLRSRDPLERYEGFFKALEYFASTRKGDDPSTDRFDRQLSAVTTTVDAKFDQAKIKEYRELRNRIVHTRTTHPLGHIGPNDIEDIQVVRTELPEMERLVRALLKNPPPFPR